jgi:hypothetical protein
MSISEQRAYLAQTFMAHTLAFEDSQLEGYEAPARTSRIEDLVSPQSELSAYRAKVCAAYCVLCASVADGVAFCCCTTVASSQSLSLMRYMRPSQVLEGNLAGSRWRQRMAAGTVGVHEQDQNMVLRPLVSVSPLVSHPLQVMEAVALDAAEQKLGRGEISEVEFEVQYLVQLCLLGSS